MPEFKSVFLCGKDYVSVGTSHEPLHSFIEDLIGFRSGLDMVTSGLVPAWSDVLWVILLGTSIRVTDGELIELEKHLGMTLRIIFVLSYLI